MPDTTPKAVHPPKLGLGTKLLYGVGSMANGATLQIMGGLLLLYYNQVLGLPAQWVSLALGISVLIDAFWDPLIGQFSDKLRTPWGRRHPLMYASAIPVAVAFALLWMPPAGLSHSQLFTYLLVGILSVRLAASFYEVPSGALAPELAPDYHDRTVLIGFRWLLGTVGAAVAAVLAYGIFLRATPEFPQGQLNPAGYPPMALSVAALIAASILVSTLGTHHRIPGLHKPVARKISLRETLGEVAATLNNWNFGVAVVAGVVSATSLALYTGLTIYFIIYFWELPSSSTLLIVLMGLISAPIAAAVAPPLSRLWGKRRACMTLFFASVVTTNGPITLRLLDLFPENGSPMLLPILLANAVLGGVFGTGGFILVTSMIADIVEESQVKTGRRSEGLLFSADSLLNKIVSGFATVLPGLLLAFVGFPTGVTPANLDPEIMRRLAYIYVPITVTLSLLSIATWRFYRIDASAHEANLAALQDATPAE
ncbi:MFS transporter [Phenylobacterium sp.]|uniref:MFS transporter n=1 Tax=Phenylobacterium sp. TaxID=1871053 RepID=UPI00286B89CE|nr:MFS transporter [Phenylobacterium sp.]